MSALFVTGAGTEIGKTYVACAVLRSWRASGLACDAFKPVASGFDPMQAEASDPGQLLSALGEATSADALARMSPWRFKAPAAPPLAAKAEGVTLEFDVIARACRARIAVQGKGMLLIEGAGGVMAPLTDTHTNLDLIAALNVPALFVAGSYLGAVSHALTGLAVLDARGIIVRAIVISESEASAGLDATAAMIGALRRQSVVVLARRNAPQAWSDVMARLLADQSSI